jgi:hypothetical protein
MEHLTNPIGSIRRASEWYEFSTDSYLDHRHRNWLLAEEQCDVIFVTARGVVLVHRERAEHIVRELHGTLGVALQQPVLALPARQVSPAPPAVRQPTAVDADVATTSPSRWRTACGWFGIVVGAAVFVGSLAVPLDDPALVTALALGLRGGRLIHDVDS